MSSDRLACSCTAWIISFGNLHLEILSMDKKGSLSMTMDRDLQWTVMKLFNDNGP